VASGSINAHRPKVCMLAYCDSPTALPSMLNEGASLAGAGFEVESLCLASAATPPSEAHAPGFRTRRFPVRVREFFQGLLGFAPSGRRLVRFFRRGAMRASRFFKQPPTLVTPRDFDLSPYFEIVKYNLFEEMRFDYRKILWVDGDDAANS